MGTLWNFLVTFAGNLPWVAIALMAALALRRQRQSTFLMLQATGAAAVFVLAVVRWVIVWLLTLTGATPAASPTLHNALHVILGFLTFVALGAFAVGYCAERFRRRAGGPSQPVQVTATPVDD